MVESSRYPFPEKPEWLDELAQKAWDYLVPLLQQMGVLTRIDANALSRYCHLWSRWREAETFIAKHGLMYPLKDDDGQPKCFQPWPRVSIANKLTQQLTRLEQEFDMTPSARSRLMLAAPVKQYPGNSIMRLVRAR